MLTKRDIDALVAPAKGNRIKFDGPGGVAGFGIRITAAGARAFILNYRTKGGLDRRLTIGGYPTWTVAAARDRARELRRLIDVGRDPLGEKIADREAPTMRDLAKRAVEEHYSKRRPSTLYDVQGQLDKWILPALGSMKVADVRPADIEKLHARVTSAGSPIRANRVVSTLSKMFSLALRWEYRETNPCRHAVDRNSETARKRYLEPAEFRRLAEVLATYPHKSAAYAVGLLVATGSRRMEVLSADWSQFNLAARTWLKPAATTKQGTDHVVPLNATALDLLDRLEPDPQRRHGYLFPCRGPGGHLTDLKNPWAAISRMAGIPDVRLHDLRHSFASAAISTGATLPEVGGLLGHTNAATTSRYAHLYLDRLREITDATSEVMSGKPPGGS
jgi:integrase